MRNELRALNVVTDEWREIETNIGVDKATLDENSDVLFHNLKDGYFYGSGVRASVSTGYKSKSFFLSYDRATIVWYIHVTYLSGSALTFNFYADGSGEPEKSFTLPASSAETTQRLIIKYRAKNFHFEINESEDSTQSVEIRRISIRHD